MTVDDQQLRERAERCYNTIHSDYVTDHQCQRERGHEGSCQFGGEALLSRVVALTRRLEIVGRMALRGAGPDTPPEVVLETIRHYVDQALSDCEALSQGVERGQPIPEHSDPHGPIHQ